MPIGFDIDSPHNWDLVKTLSSWQESTHLETQSGIVDNRVLWTKSRPKNLDSHFMAGLRVECGPHERGQDIAMQGRTGI